MQSPSADSTTGSLKRLQSVIRNVFSPGPEKLKRADVPVTETIEKSARLPETSNNNNVKIIKYKHASVQTKVQGSKNMFYGTNDVLEHEELTKKQQIWEQRQREKEQAEDDALSNLSDPGDCEQLPKLLGKVSIRRRSHLTSTDSLNLPRTRKRFIKFDRTAVLLDAAGNGDVSELKSILEGEKAMHVDACTGEGVTALHAACTSLQLEAVGYLLSLSAHVNAADSQGNTPLHIAATKGHLILVQKLVQAGASVEAVNNDGKTAIDCTNFAECREYLRLVLQRKMMAERVQALYDFDRGSVKDGRGDEMTVCKGDMLQVLDRSDVNWWLVYRAEDGARGYVPRALVQ